MATILVENVGLDFTMACNAACDAPCSRARPAEFIDKKDLQHRHVTVTALTDVSFQLSDGDRLALVGHNGAGKWSLLKVLQEFIIRHPVKCGLTER